MSIKASPRKVVRERYVHYTVCACVRLYVCKEKKGHDR